MTRTARATYPRAVQKDRSESRSGVDSSIRKGGAGQHNWGSISDERQLESAAFDDEDAELEEVGREVVAVEDTVLKASTSRDSSNSDDDLEEARKFRKNALHKKNIDLSAIARTSVAASTSPPSITSNFVRRSVQGNKQVPLSPTTAI